MITKAHHKLAKRYDKRPLRLVINDRIMEIFELIFTEEEAYIASYLPLQEATSKEIAKRVRRPESEVRPILDSMGKKGLIFYNGDGPTRKYMMMAFVMGLFENYMWANPYSEKTKKFAQLFDEYYLKDGYMPNFIKKDTSAFRIIPVEESINDNIGALPGEKVREIIDSHNEFSFSHICACRNHKEMIGEGCGKPKDVCLHFAGMARWDIKMNFGRRASKEEAMEAIDRAEEASLIHFVDNVMKPQIICNCCSCCCGAFTALNAYSLPALFANSRFIADYDPKKCNNCGKCAKACPMAALHVYGKKLIFDITKCIGCGNCVPKCKDNAVKMVLRKDARPIPGNYGELAVDMTTEYWGIQKFTDKHFPGLTRSMGMWAQKKIEKRFNYTPE